MQRIEAEWQAYKTMVVPPDAEEIQIQETKKAFYAGAVAVYDIIEKYAMSRQFTPAEGRMVVDALIVELQTFKDKMNKGLI